MKKAVFLSLGFVCVGLGTLGIFIPVLPTTPFLLLAAYLFARSSPRYNAWLIKTPVLGEYIRNYREGGGVSLRNKIIAIAFLWLMLGYTALTLVNSWWIRGLLLLVAVGVTTHLVRLKTRPRGQTKLPGSPVKQAKDA